MMVDEPANVAIEQIVEQAIDLSVELTPDLRFSNPIMISSGILGFERYREGHVGSLPLRQLGAVVPKTATLCPRDGNKEPRLFPKDYKEAWGGGEQLFLNSFGLNNPGMEAVVKEWAPLWAKWDTTVMISIGGFSIPDFGKAAALADDAVGIRAVEVNLSCPNVEDRGIFSHDCGLARAAIEAVRSNTSLPIFAKLAPNVPDIALVAEAAVDGGADGLTICNTIPAIDIDVSTASPVLGNVYGGLSGPSLRPISLALVHQTSRVLKEKGKSVPIIGVGGISKAEHALKFIMAGASAVQIGTANWVDPTTAWRVLDELRKYLADSGISSLAELRGAAHPVPAGSR